jgi:hypothetical protein
MGAVQSTQPQLAQPIQPILIAPLTQYYVSKNGNMVTWHRVTMIPSTQYYVSKNGNMVSPATCLDNVLKLKSYKKDVYFTAYNIFNGEILSTEISKQKLHNTLMDHHTKKQYMTTDHLIYSIRIDNMTFFYVSLGNNIRSNIQGYPLAHTRILALCTVLVKVFAHCKGPYIVFTSEGGSSSFYGNINERCDEISWFKMRGIIEKMTGLKFLIEKNNKDDNSGLSFAVSAWTSLGAEEFIGDYYVQNILPTGNGSGTVGIRLISGKIVWCVHFPLDFKSDDEKNDNYVAMIELQKVMDTYPGSICAMGNFNTVPGKIENLMIFALNYEYEFLLKDFLSFFGSFFDTIDVKHDESVTWKHISDIS